MSMIAVLLSLALAERLDEVLLQMKQAGDRLQSLRASFEQIDHDYILEEQESTEGKLYVKLPGRIRWEYEPPREKVLLVKDDLVRLYNPTAHQVQEFDRSKSGGRAQAADLLVGFGKSNSEIGKNYDVSLVSEDAKTVVLDLVPKPDSAASIFTKVQLTLDKSNWTPLRSVFYEPNRDWTEIHFSNVVLNGPIDDGTFELDLPPDVEIIRN